MEKKSQVITVDLLRHGEPEGGRRYRGKTDDPLSELGWQQMWGAVAHEPAWQAIITSPLSRCAAFAQQLADKHRVGCRASAALMEIGFGRWEGKTVAEIQRLYPEEFSGFLADPVNNPPAGAERIADFKARIGQEWLRLLADPGGEHILVVCHAGVIRMILHHVLEFPLAALFRLRVDYASLTRVQITRQDQRRDDQLIFHNRIASS